MVPITVHSKALVRELCTEHYEWDAPLPAEKETQWKSWKDSIKALEQLHIPGSYLPISLLFTQHRRLCVFSDVSTMANSAVAYLRAVIDKGHSHVGFCTGKSKVAPYHSHSVTRIRRSSQPEQWHFISTEDNPADHGTRPVAATLLGDTNWYSGPSFLRKDHGAVPLQPKSFDLAEPDTDADVRPLIITFATKASATLPVSHRFECFSSWKLLTRGIAKLIQKVRSFSKARKGDMPKADELVQARTVIVRSVQQEALNPLGA